MALTMSQEKMLFYLEKLTAPFIRVTQYTEKCEACLPPALMVTGPCLPGDCLLRTDSRANFHPEICSGAAMAVTNIECHESGGLITIMKYYCHVSRVSLIASALATAQINIRMSVTQLLGHFLNPSGLQVLGFICYECQ